MHQYEVGFPIEEVAMGKPILWDLMGLFPESQNGNKYVLVIVDTFSKWMDKYQFPKLR